MSTLDMRLTAAPEGTSTDSHFTDEVIKGRSHLQGVRKLSSPHIHSEICTYLAQRSPLGLTPQALVDTGAWCSGQSWP